MSEEKKKTPARNIQDSGPAKYSKSRLLIRRLCVCGILTALSVVIGILCKNLMTWGIYYRVTFENFPIILAGYCFGPVWGLASAVAADIISCLCSTNPVVNPIITAGAACVGLCSGLCPLLLKKTHVKAQFMLAASVASAHLIGQVAVKSLGKIVFYGMPSIGVLIGLGISCAAGTAEYFFILFLLRNPEIRKILRGMTENEL